MARVGCIWFWITDHATVLSAVISAIAAGIIACFTVTLARATRGLKTSADKQIAEAKALTEIAGQQTAIQGLQTDIQKKQHAIGRLQFLASHRPRLRIRHVVIGNGPAELSPTLFFNHGAEINGSLIIVNAGGTQAKIIESRYRIYFSRTGLPPVPPYERSFHGLLLVGQTLEVGESNAVAITDKIVMEPPPGGVDIELRAFEKGGWQVFVMGQIRYVDDGNVERFMGFCRLRESDGRFRAVYDPDYEYEDWYIDSMKVIHDRGFP